MRFQLLFALLAGLLVNQASAAVDSAVISQRQSINSTQSSFFSNINSKITDLASKLTSLRTDMSSQMSSATQTLTTFMSDSTIGTAALAANDAVNGMSQSLSTSTTDGTTALTGFFNNLKTCTEAKLQNATNWIFAELVAANQAFSTAVSGSSSQYASTCNGRYSGTAESLVNQAGGQLQNCLNKEGTPQSRISSILNNYMQALRQNYQSMTNNIRSCSSLGSTSSRAEIKAQIAACLNQFVATVAANYNATFAQQYLSSTTMLQLEFVAAIDRVKSCINIVTATYVAMARAIPAAVSTCLSTGQ